MRYLSCAAYCCLLFVVVRGQNGYNYPVPENHLGFNNDLPIQTSYHPNEDYVPPPENHHGYDYSPPTPPPVPEEEKKIYVHIPPDNTEQSLEIPQHALPPRKHYKIIFVKAPSPPKTPVATPPPVEEKTLVYVLVKKPEGPSEEEIRAAAEQSSLKPSKPEVYFINYKTRKEKGPSFYGENSIDVRSGGFESSSSLGKFGEPLADVGPAAGNLESSSFGSSDTFSLPASLTPPPSTPGTLYGAPNFRH